MTLVDAAQKKCAFLTQARLDLRLDNVEVVHARVETLRAPPFDVVVSRALTSLAQFVAWTRHLLQPHGRWLAMKGRRPDEELVQLPPDILAAVEALQVPGLGEQRHVISMRKA
jgi:16S rRNA (guanine527-N7)-methyltransferase